MPLSHRVAVTAAFLPGTVGRDPADRLLIATAREFGVPLVARDRRFLDYAWQGHGEAIARRTPCGCRASCSGPAVAARHGEPFVEELVARYGASRALVLERVAAIQMVPPPWRLAAAPFTDACRTSGGWLVRKEVHSWSGILRLRDAARAGCRPVPRIR